MRFETSMAELQQLWTEVQIQCQARPVLAGVIGTVVLVHALAWARIFWKMGYSPVLGFMAIVPPCALLFPFVLAFLPTPADRELATLRGIERVMQQSQNRFRRAG
jgi:hypothetical protein